MHQQLESAKCVCYDLTPTKTHPYRRLPVNFNLLLLQKITLRKDKRIIMVQHENSLSSEQVS